MEDFKLFDKGSGRSSRASISGGTCVLVPATDNGVACPAVSPYQSPLRTPCGLILAITKAIKHACT